MLFVLNSNAQNKVTPVSNSAIAGIALPEGSKQDKRGLFVVAARVLLETVSKPKGTGIVNTELLYLPVSYTIDSLKAALQNANWIISPAEGEKDYLWLQQNNKQVLVRFSPGKKNQDLYIGETAQPVVSSSNKIDTLQVNNNNAGANNNTVPIQQTVPNNNPVQPVVTSSTFTFTTTNWQDGWTSNIKEDWVEVTKGNIKVLLHYPNKKADAYNSVLKDGDYEGWNTLVAPRYSNMTNFEWKSIQSWESITFMQADATEISSGKNVHIVLFKKHYSTGIGRYLEFVTDNKADYENEFGPYHNTEFDWDKTANMQFRNKFSVAANDIIGKWSTTDYASISYYYVNTGGLAGTTATSTADEFTFLPGNNYESDHSGASGMVGNMKFSRQVYKGQSTVNNWDITLTNRFQGASEKFESYFESVKGGRALILKDHLNTVFTLVKQP
jgi:hypothetical protein